MFYLKYRPRTIKEIDNSRVRDILAKILDSQSLPHALLFIGQKGTGKTSAARIFAKAVNCLNNKFANKNNKNYDPCNDCEHCKSITRSSFTDVLELDAASNRGIEEVKSLIRETAFLPLAGRFRVFIIDEAHMITADGFNALLKTLEEPPSSAIFILATTNPEKVPLTIASRCVTVNFGKGKKSDIIHMLERVLKEEKKSVDPAILNSIANHADSSFRDGTKLLEEILVQNITTKENADQFLGVRGKSNILTLLEGDDVASSLKWLNEFYESGGNVKNLIEDILNDLRLLLLSKKGVSLDIELIPSKLTTSEIVSLIKLLMEAYQNLRNTPIESLPLEIALTEFYNKRNTN